MEDNPVPDNAMQQADTKSVNPSTSATGKKKTAVADSLESQNPRRAESVDFLDIVFILSAAIFLVLFVFTLAGSKIPPDLRDLLTVTGKVGKYVVTAAGGTAFVSQVIRMLIRRPTNRYLLLYIFLAFVLLLGSSVGLTRMSANNTQGYTSAILHLFPSYPHNTVIMFAHTYHDKLQEKLREQDDSTGYLGHLDLAYDLSRQSPAFVNVFIRGDADSLKDPKHPKPDSKDLPIYVICLQRSKAGLEALNDIFMKCGDHDCDFDSALDKGLAISCGGSSGAQALAPQHTSLFSPQAVLAATLLEKLPISTKPYWTVPTLETLENENISERGGYTRFDVTLTPSGALRSSNSYQYQLIVNGQPVFFNGFPPEAFRSQLDPSKPIQFAFGLRNLNFSGAGNGFEDLELQLTFFNDETPTLRQTVTRKYVALRSDDPGHPLDAKKGVVQSSAVGSFEWKATYLYSSQKDVYTAQAFSVLDLAGIAGVKKVFDPYNLTFENQRVVLVPRPPLWCNPWVAGDIGLVQEATGQVRFTFDKDEVTRLSTWARDKAQTSSLPAARELKRTQPYNLGYRLSHPCEAKGKA